MKMSRSIKDYKDAMDSIRISDSFYKRTETLLNELHEEEIEKRPFYMSRRITGGIMAAAACLICIVGIRTVMGIRQSNIESADETGLTEIVRDTTATEVSVPELIDILEDEDSVDEMLSEGNADAADENAEEEVVTARPLTVDAGGGAAAVPDDPKPESETSGENGGSTNSTTAGGSGSDKVTAGGTGSSGAKDTSAEQDISMLDDIAFQYVTVEITPYFDMNDIVSGESSLKIEGEDCRELIGFMRDLSENSYKLPNSSFKSLFSLSIADEDMGLTFYSIYVTNQNTMIITKHNLDDGQQRVTYGLSVGKSKELKQKLFLMFGEESDYELFENLVSGK